MIDPSRQEVMVTGISMTPEIVGRFKVHLIQKQEDLMMDQR